MAASLKAGRDLVLRPLCLRDAGPLFDLIEANRERLRRWLPWLDRNFSKADTRAHILRLQTLARQGLASPYGVWWKGRLVGAVSFNWIDDTNRSAAIGYWLAAEAEGHGLMTAAVSALLRHGFNTLQLHRIEIRAGVRNRRSRSVAVRLGFRHEGTLKDAEQLYDRFVDHAVYGLLLEAWKQLNATRCPPRKRD